MNSGERELEQREDKRLMRTLAANVLRRTTMRAPYAMISVFAVAAVVHGIVKRNADELWTGGAILALNAAAATYSESRAQDQQGQADQVDQ